MYDFPPPEGRQPPTVKKYLPTRLTNDWHLRTDSDMWIYLPDEDGKEAWGGTIVKNKGSKSRWTFELIRHVDNPTNLYDSTPFDDQRPVVGLLDYQTRCTVIWPIVTHIDPGSIGNFVNFYRTRIEGECDSLLRGLAITDAEEKIFLGVKFTSQAFSTWFSAPLHKHDFDTKSHSPGMKIAPDKRERITIPNVGIVECVTGARFVDLNVHSTSVTSSSLFSLTFDVPQSLEQIRELSFGLESLFGFLIGYRGELPTFSVWIDKKYTIAGQSHSYSGNLEISGTPFVEGGAPHPMRCIHLGRSNPKTLKNILEKFFENKDDILTRIHVVEFCRFFSTNLNDRFSVIMPVLEQYIRSKYIAPDETDYMQHKGKFFSYIDSSSDEEITEFSKKHIKLQKEKSPSLSTLLERAIVHLNDKGLQIPVKFAKDIQQRRGQVFHSARSMTANDVHCFNSEITVAVALLLFHTFEDLGINLEEITSNYSSLTEMRDFMKRPPTPKYDPTAPIMTPTEALKHITDSPRADNIGSRCRFSFRRLWKRFRSWLPA